MMNPQREEVVESLHNIEYGVASLKIFKPIVSCWRAFVRVCQPLFNFHDKYSVYIWSVVLCGSVALMVGYMVYLR